MKQNRLKRDPSEQTGNNRDRINGSPAGSGIERQGANKKTGLTAGAGPNTGGRGTPGSRRPRLQAAAPALLLAALALLLCGCPPNGAPADEKPAVVRVTGVSVTPAEVSVYLGDTAEVTAALEPAGAANQGVTWSSGDTDIATVAADADNPLTAVVTAEAAGTTVITATTTDGSFTAECSVTVTGDGTVDVTVE
jgi:uncharacterized protein YjdB